jgi:hypothetical protein
MIVVVGGENSLGPLPYIEKFVKGSVWRELPVRLTIPRSYYGGVVGGDSTVFIFGGVTQTGTVPIAEVFNVGENHVSVSVSLSLQIARQKFTCALDEDHVYAIGGISPWSPQDKILASNDQLTLITGVADENPSLPCALALHQNYPNPFNPNTTIAYDIPMGFSSNPAVTLEVFNTLGERVISLFRGAQAPGTYSVALSADYLSSGVYLYKLTVGGEAVTRRMVLLK